MSRNGSGVYTAPSNSWNPATGTISSTDWNSTLDDIETAISASIASDGQTTTSARIPFAAGVSAFLGATSGPSYTFAGDPNTGFYSPSADKIGIVAGGTEQVRIESALVAPIANNTVDLGTSALKFKDGFFEGNVTITGTLSAGSLTGSITVSDGAITSAKLATNVITTLVAETAVDTADELMLYDVSATTLDKCTVNNLFKAVNTFTAETAVDTADVLFLYDASGSAAEKATVNELFKAVNTFTAETAVDTADILYLYDASAATADKVTVNNLHKAVNTFTAETAVDKDDVVGLYDSSAATMDKATVENILKATNTLTEDTSPDTAADFALVYDTSAGTVKKVKPSNLGGGGTFASGTLSGASTTITSAITSSIKRVVVALSDGSGVTSLRIGDGGGIESSGYQGGFSSDGAATTTFTTGFDLPTNIDSAHFELMRIGTSEQWVCKYGGHTSGVVCFNGAGKKTTSAATTSIAVIGSAMSGNYSVTLLPA